MLIFEIYLNEYSLITVVPVVKFKGSIPKMKQYATIEKEASISRYIVKWKSSMQNRTVCAYLRININATLFTPQANNP